MAALAHRLRRLLVRGGLLVLLLLVLAYVTREQTLGPLLVRVARAPLERALGARLEVGRLSGNWLTGLVVEDLSLTPLAGRAPVVSVANGRLELTWSPGLFLGRFAALERLSLAARHVRVDPAAAPPSDETVQEEEEPASLPETLPELALAIDDFELVLDDEITLEFRELEVAGDGDSQRLELAAELAWREPERTIARPLRARGIYRSGTVTFDELHLGDELALRAATLALGGPLVTYEVAGELCGGSFSARGTGGRLELALAGASLERVSALIELAPPLVGTCDAEGEVDLDRGTVQLALSGRELVLGGVRLDGLSGRLALAPESLAVAGLRAWRGDNVLASTELRLALGTQDSAELLRSLEGAWQATLREVPLLLAAEPESVPAHTVELAGRFDHGTVALEHARVETRGGSLTLRQGELQLVAGEPLSRARLALNLDVAFDELAELARLVGREDVHGALEGTLAVAGPLSALRGTLDGRVRGLQVAGRGLGDGVLLVASDGARVDLERLELDGELGRLVASGSFDLEQETLHEVRVEAEDVALAELGRPELRAGTAALTVLADGPLRAPRGTLALQASQLVVEGFAADQLRLRASCDGESLRVETLELARGAGSLSLQGELAREATEGWRGTLAALTASYGAARLTLAAPSTLLIHSPERWSLEPVRLEGNGSAQLAAEREGDSLRVSLACERFDPSFLGPLLTADREAAWRTSGIDAHVELNRTPDALRAAFDVLVPELRFSAEDPPWTAIARGGFDGRRLTLDRLVVDHERVGTLTATGSVPLDPLADDAAGWFSDGPLELTASADLELGMLARRIARLPDSLNGRLRAEASLSGGWHQARGRVRVHTRELALDWLGEGFAGARASVSLDLDAAETCKVGPLAIAAEGLGTIRAEGTVAAPLDAAALVSGDLGRWREAPVDLKLELDIDDMGWLARRTDAVRRVSGGLRSTLTLAGTLAQPSYEGTLEFDDASLRPAVDFPSFEALSGRVKLSGRTVELEDLHGELGAAPFVVKGTLWLAGPERAETELALALEGENLLLARTSGLRVRANTDLTVTGPLSALRTTGRLFLTEGRYGRDLDFLAALRGEAAPPTAGGRGITLQFWRDPPLSAMQFDVEIQGGELQVENNIASVALRPDLRLHGTGEVPLLVGRVFVEPGTLSLPSGSLAIDSGLIDFRSGAPFSPGLELSGRTRIKGFDIGVRVTGEVLAPEIELWSTPPLPGDELLVLFLTGELPEGGTEARSEAAAKTVAVYLAKDYLTRWLQGGSEGGSTGLLERIEVEVGADVTRSGAPTTDVTYYFSDRPRGAGWVPYLNAERDKYDKYNMGIGLLFRTK